MRSDQRDGGFVLIGVLLVVGVLMAISLAYVSIVRKASDANSTMRRQIEAQLLADGVARGVAFVLARDGAAMSHQSGIAIDGTPLTCRVANNEAQVIVIDTAGLVDINHAPIQLLERLLRGVGLEQQLARRLAGAIIDYRDADDELAVGTGRESISTDPSHRPFMKNRSFTTVAELEAVRGFDRALIERLRPLLTVHGHQHDISPQRAPVALLEAFARADNGVVGASSIAALRRSYRPLLDFDSGGGPRAFVVKVIVSTRWGVRAWRWAVVEPSSEAPGQFLVREWAQHVFQNEIGPGALAATDCADFVR